MASDRREAISVIAAGQRSLPEGDGAEARTTPPSSSAVLIGAGLNRTFLKLPSLLHRHFALMQGTVLARGQEAAISDILALLSKPRGGWSLLIGTGHLDLQRRLASDGMKHGLAVDALDHGSWSYRRCLGGWTSLWQGVNRCMTFTVGRLSNEMPRTLVLFLQVWYMPLHKLDAFHAPAGFGEELVLQLPWQNSFAHAFFLDHLPHNQPFGLPFREDGMPIALSLPANLYTLRGIMATLASRSEVGSTELVPLYTTGVDFHNKTQAQAFLKKLNSGKLLRGPEDADFWYGIVIVIGIATIINASFLVTTWTRLRAGAAKRPHPTRPSNVVSKAFAGIARLVRTMAYRQYVPKRVPWLTPPPLGICILLLIYLGYIIGLAFYKVSIPGAQHYEALGQRAGWICVAQLPLLLLLAGKNNLIGVFTGISYERLNVFHRWVGRTIWLTATLHWAYQQHGWGLYGLIALEKATGPVYYRGVVAWTLLTWMNISSIAPLRNWHYEFFVLQHVLTWMGFIVAVLYHIPFVSPKIYLYLPIGAYLFDRLISILRYGYNNSRLGRATITALPGGVSKVQIKSSRLKHWTPGQHAFITIPRFSGHQMHPATILSTPQSHGGDLVFIMKARKGFTSRLLASATSSGIPRTPPSESSSGGEKSSFSAASSIEIGVSQQKSHIALVSGPYGSSHLDFAAFDSVMLIAGSTGITFDLPLLLDISARAQRRSLPLRRLTFVWIVKSSTWTSWVTDELRSAVEGFRSGGVELEIKIFATKDDTLTDATTTNLPQAQTTAAHGELQITTTRPGTLSRTCSCVDAKICACVTDVMPVTTPVSMNPSSPSPAKESFAITTTKMAPPRYPALSAPVMSSSSSIYSLQAMPQLRETVRAQPTTDTPVDKPQVTTTETVLALPDSTPLRVKGLDFATLHAGRPALEELITVFAGQAEGEAAVGVCGPLGLNGRVRNAVRGKAVYLHVEGFGW